MFNFLGFVSNTSPFMWSKCLTWYCLQIWSEYLHTSTFFGAGAKPDGLTYLNEWSSEFKVRILSSWVWCLHRAGLIGVKFACSSCFCVCFLLRDPFHPAFKKLYVRLISVSPWPRDWFRKAVGPQVMHSGCPLLLILTVGWVKFRELPFMKII